VAADVRDRGAYTEPPADAFWRTIVELPPLTPAQSEELLRRRLEGDQPSDALEWIVENADGNPRRLLSLAHDVIVEGSDPSELMTKQRERAAKEEQLSEPARRLLAELIERLTQEVDGPPVGVGEQADLVPLGLQALDQRARERGLAAAVLAGEHPAALAMPHGVDETHERLAFLGGRWIPLVPPAVTP